MIDYQITAVYEDKQKELTRLYPRPDKNLSVDLSAGDWWRVRHDFERFDHGFQEKPFKYGKPRQLLGGYEQKDPMPQTQMTWQLSL